MGVRLEWIDAQYASVSSLLPGDEAADHQEHDIPDTIGIQIVGDDGVVITGTPRMIRQLALDVIAATFEADRTLADRAQAGAT